MSKNIIVAKFGGTSMADAAAISQSAGIAVSRQASLVVVSATAGTTDSLVELAEAAFAGERSRASKIISGLIAKHQKIAQALEAEETVENDLEILFKDLRTVIDLVRPAARPPQQMMDRILSFGERISSLLMLAALSRQGIPAELIDARQIIRTDSHFGRATPVIDAIADNTRLLLAPKIKAGKVIVTQGFVGSSLEGATTTLGRGGSDYSAALLAEALQAKEVQIWTDVSGIASSDPRIVKTARKIDHLTFQEAAELATAGAKILYPRTITPSRRAGIPVFVGNTFAPEAGGTKISKQTDHQPLIRAIALKKDQCLVSLTTIEMSYQFGYLAKIFGIFAKYKISIDQISTSEITVSVVLENRTLVNKELLDELRQLGEVKVEKGLSVISLIGNDVNDSPGLAQAIFTNLEGEDGKIAVRMICQGASRHNFCFLVADRHGPAMVRKLHARFIESYKQ